MGIKPFSTIQEAFAEVRREDSRKKLMMTNTNISPTVKGSTLCTYSSSQNKVGKGRLWYDHCKRSGHVKTA